MPAPYNASAGKLLAGGWFPEFDFIALGVDDPAELAEVRFVNLVQNIAALFT